MGKAVELVSVRAIAPSTGAAGVVFTGNSLTIRQTTKPAWLVALWQVRQVAGFTRIVSPLLHDNVVGIQIAGGVGVQMGLQRPPQRLEGQDTLAATLSGSAAAGDVELSHWMVSYEDLPGIAGRFISPSELLRRSEGSIYSSQNSIAAVDPGTPPAYGGEEAISAEQDQFKANRDYAIVGYSVQSGSGSVRYRSPDWGNLGVGGPAVALRGELYSDWFVRISELSGEPLIPVFNSSNRALTLIDAAVDENGTDIVLTTLMALLK